MGNYYTIIYFVLVYNMMLFTQLLSFECTQTIEELHKSMVVLIKDQLVLINSSFIYGKGLIVN